MWADTLLTLERGHLVRLALWGGGCLLVGALILAWLTWQTSRAPLLKHFAMQTAAWGAIDLAMCYWGWHTVALRDYAAALQLMNFLWLNVGLDAGYVMLGATLAITSWRLGAKAAGIGAGIGIGVQGLALMLLDVRLIVAIGPFQ